MADAPDASPAGLREHPLRIALTNEVHARPYERLAAPVRVSYLALLSGVESADGERAAVAALCERHGAPPPGRSASHHAVDLGAFRLKWERHTEFSSYAFIVGAPFAAPFEDPPVRRVPADWLAALPGSVLTAVHVALEPRDRGDRSRDELGALLAPDSLVGSRVSGGAATAWTDFRIHADGFGRILLRDQGLGSRQAGRLVQRLLEIETYRMLALLALPLAREHTPALHRLDQRLAETSEALTGRMDIAEQRRLLGELSRQASELERIAAATGFRFSAARAYHRLVERRIEELRESRHDRLQTIGEFMQRRLAPAMRTCESVQERIDALAVRIARVSDLLRTRVNVAMESQSRDLLASMDRRARLQLRLQQTVEGLSVVVLSYYLVGLVRYALKGLHAAGLPLDVDLATALAIVPVVAAVVLGVRRVRRLVEGDAGPPGGTSG